MYCVRGVSGIRELSNLGRLVLRRKKAKIKGMKNGWMKILKTNLTLRALCCESAQTIPSRLIYEHSDVINKRFQWSEQRQNGQMLTLQIVHQNSSSQMGEKTTKLPEQCNPVPPRASKKCFSRRCWLKEKGESCELLRCLHREIFWTYLDNLCNFNTNPLPFPIKALNTNQFNWKRKHQRCWKWTIIWFNLLFGGENFNEAGRAMRFHWKSNISMVFSTLDGRIGHMESTCSC
jgi:hypothetical protein